MRAATIIATCLSASLLYGILLMQVTARISPDYFLVNNKYATESLTVIAIANGALGAWKIGLFIGILAAIAATVGSRPKRSAESLLGAIGLVMLAATIGAALFGVAAHALNDVWFSIPEELAAKVAQEHRAAYLGVNFAHVVAGAFGLFGGLSMVLWTFLSRRDIKPPANEEEEFLKRMAVHQQPHSHANTDEADHRGN